MIHLALLVLAAQAPADTVSLPVAAAFQEAMAVAPELTVARQQALAAANQAEQASAVLNPSLTVAAENLGRAREVTGLDAPQGIEGQAVLAFPLPLGPTRSGTVGAARAAGAVASADLRLAEVGAAQAVLASLGGLIRHQALVENARVELETLQRLSQALSLQAAEGRAAISDAARARLAQGLAATSLARREAALAEIMGEVTRRLGRAPTDWLTLEAPRCEAPSSLAGPVEGEGHPEARRATALLDAARASVSLARGLSIPDFEPHVGWRRGAGTNALYLGFSTSLPLFDRGSRRVAAARNLERAAEAELAAVEARLATERVAAQRALSSLEAAGAVFTGAWFQALDQAVTAAEARYELGEGTLFELLDNRRARLQALDDYAAWQAEWWQARARLTRLQGRQPDATIICTDPFRESD